MEFKFIGEYKSLSDITGDIYEGDTCIILLYDKDGKVKKHQIYVYYHRKWKLIGENDVNEDKGDTV